MVDDRYGQTETDLKALEQRAASSYTDNEETALPSISSSSDA